MDNPERVTYFAATDSRGKRIPFGLKAKDRQRHMYVIGKTGMGKSTLLENMAIQDIQNGEGLAFIDPHGSAVETLLNYIPPERVNDVVYFAPFDMEQPIAFNVMEDVGYDKRHLVVSGLMATFKKIWEDAWSARMEYILTNTLLALLEYPDATLLGVNRMYTDKAYRAKVVDNIKDPVVKDFWTKEFAGYTDRFTQEATPAIQNKIGQFTGNPLIRNIIGQPKSSFDIRQLMDQKKILLINLSKGLVGDTNMRLLGSMLVTRIFLAAMSRAELSPQELKKANQFYLYVDEFQNFANDTFSEILSEARKYSLNLIIAHQYVEQMEEQVRAAVFGNVGTTVAFRVGPFDAETLETIFTPEFMKEDLVNLGFAQIYLTLMIDGVGSRPFSAVTIPPIEPPAVSYREQVIDSSRKQFASQRSKIEEAIFSELAESGPTGPVEPPKRQYGPQQGGQGNNGGQNRSQGTGSGQGGTGPRPQGAGGTGGNGGAPRSDRPRQDAPREGNRPQGDSSSRSNAAPPRRDAPERAAPPAASKTADDLKAILRGMTAGATKEKDQKGNAGAQKPQGAEASPLKGALADVLGKAGTQDAPPAAAPAPKPQAQREPQSPPKAAPADAPYEVPEQTLRDIFREPK